MYWPAGLDRNGYDRNACRAEFDAYKDCKQKEVWEDTSYILRIILAMFVAIYVVTVPRLWQRCR